MFHRSDDRSKAKFRAGNRPRFSFRPVVCGLWIPIPDNSVFYQCVEHAIRRKKARFLKKPGLKLAGWTGLEPATFCVTGRRSNQLSYHPGTGKEAERRFRLRQVKLLFAILGAREFAEKLQCILPVLRDLGGQFLNAGKLLFRPQKLQPMHR